MISLKYRGDIDGLRAVAVLGVVIFHAFPQNLSGGFCGVDIFFVISGYLISGILYKGHREENFSFREFYERRIRRLFPALITMLVLSLAYGWLILLPDEFEQMGKHIAAGTLFIQNFVFWGESGYFDTVANLKPMLHLWSLAVEEQFYIIFPLLLIVLWKKPRMLVPTMVTLLIVSLVANVVMSYQAVMTDFFLTPYRSWEFLAGSLLAWWHYDRGHEEEVPKWREAMSCGGALLLAAGMLLLSKQQGAYPGWRALLPVCGTCLLIEGGRGAWVNRRILSHPALVWIGLISYPLYLFHWPILSFLHIVKGERPGDGYLAGALALSFLLATLTYYLIEKKIRHNASRWTLPALIIAFTLIGIVGLLVGTGMIRLRSSTRAFEDQIKASHDNHYHEGYQSSCLANHYTRASYGGASPRTLYLGDSNMEQYAPRIQRLINEEQTGGRGAVFIFRGGFVPIDGVVDTSKPLDKGYSSEVLEKELGPETDRVVVAAQWCYYFNWGGPSHLLKGLPINTKAGRVEALAALDAFLRRMKSMGKKTYLVLNITGCESYDPKRMIRRSFTGPCGLSEYELTMTEFLGSRGNMDCTQGELLSEISNVAKRAGAEVIDPVTALASGGICLKLYDEGRPVYYDYAHLRASFVRDHAVFMDQTIKP